MVFYFVIQSELKTDQRQIQKTYDFENTVQTSNWRCWWMVVLYAIAMAWVESAVVFYLRSMIHRIEPYQPDPLPIIGGFGAVELPRELATLIMLFAVGVLAGRTWRARIGYTVIAFGVWDIFYYVFLKIICGWPHSLLDWDILFLLPLPWWGPVLAPVLIALLMIIWGSLASQYAPPAAPSRRTWAAWLLNFSGCALALYVFMADAMTASHHGLKSLRTMLPRQFQWPLFLLALLLMTAPLLLTGWQTFRRPLKSNCHAMTASTGH
jgi:hypothetical protein